MHFPKEDRKGEGCTSSGAEDLGSCVPSNMDVGNSTNILFKNRKCS